MGAGSRGFNSPLMFSAELSRQEPLGRTWVQWIGALGLAFITLTPNTSPSELMGTYVVLWSAAIWVSLGSLAGAGQGLS